MTAPSARTRMNAIAFHRPGPVDVLEEVAVDITPRPAAGHVRVAVHAVALNHLDLWVRRGLPHLKLEMPHRLGSDVAGVVESIGDGGRPSTATWDVGSEVIVQPGITCGACAACLSGRDNFCRVYKLLGENIHGGYADFVDVPAANVMPKPARLSMVEAAAVPLTFLTAWQMVVHKAKVKRGETVLVHAAGAGVSIAALQMCKAFGARVIVTSTSAQKLERARALGADETIDSTTQDFVAECKRLTGKRGVDVVIEHLGGETFSKSLVAMTNGGRLVTCGATSGFTPPIDLRHVFFRQLDVLGSTMGSKAHLFEVVKMIDSGALRPVVDRVLPFTVEGAREAHQALEGRRVFGKIVLSRENKPI